MAVGQTLKIDRNHLIKLNKLSLYPIQNNHIPEMLVTQYVTL